ncbi:helix-turn-helix domain-containing protein [Rahnella bonaserana]|jgi:AraC family multidrug resistance transcriptional activator|uniref:Helix-turn-helix domain-containing protein n=1 Tax=Rahnella bonaserana TaxID=2816248 RepID=A0ABS6LQU8_9GAMM|nr:helix-turn-helix domain-containing protein [Rahnella bonaserana]MBU9854412.1 helix-turn-helix domain-containing protein [Rahnella bonaserana]
MNHQVFVQSLMDWIDSNIEKKLNISEVAKKSGYSKWHLQRIFREYTNKTLAKYINDSKLEKASLELLNNNSILSVSLKYGFDSPQTFTRSFTKKFKISPAKWKKKHLHKSREDVGMRTIF